MILTNKQKILSGNLTFLLSKIHQILGGGFPDEKFKSPSNFTHSPNQRRKVMKELAIGYCRVSTKKQEESGLSLQAQEDYIKNNVDGKFDVVRFFKVQESGGNSERKHLMETFKYCIENNIKHILITDSDRWTRSREMDMEAQKFIKKNDLKVHILRENRVIGFFKSASEKLVHNILIDVADARLDEITEKILFAIRAKLERGEYPRSAPQGYRNISKTKKSPAKIIQTEEIEKVIRLLETFNTGKFTLRQIIKVAKDIGLKPPKVDEFTVGTIARLIKNRFYYGEFEYSLPIIDGGKSKIYQNKTEGFDPIISKKMWEQNQAILKKRQTNHSGRNANQHVFNNLLTCGKCGGLIFGFQPKYKVKWKTKAGIQTKDYQYETHYLCNKNSYYTTNGKNVIWKDYVDSEDMVIKEDITYQETYTGKIKVSTKKGTAVEKRKCDMPYFLESEIEEMLVDKIGLIKFNKKNWQKMKENLFKDEQKEFLDYEIRSLREEKAKNEIRLDDLYDDYKKGIIDEDFFSTRKERVDNRQKEVKERLAELEEDRDLYDTKMGEAVKVLDGLKNWDLIWREADSNKKRTIANLMAIKISTVYSKGEYKGTAYENKQLRIVFTPEIEELFELGLLEADEKMRKEDPNYGVFNSPNLGNSCSDH